MNLNILATTYVDTDPERVSNLTTQVLAETKEVRSGRVIQYLGELTADLTTRHPRNARVLEFVAQHHEARRN